MTNTNAAIESLRSFAMEHVTTNNADVGRDESWYPGCNSSFAFVHLCTAALEGEEWAMERIGSVVEEWTYFNAVRCEIPESRFTEYALESIRATDTTRPDGAIARSVEV
jgi:hypothetical protein